MPVLKAKVGGNWVEVGAAAQVAPSFTKLYERAWSTANKALVDGYTLFPMTNQTSGGHFNTGTNAWVCPESGYYRMSAMAALDRVLVSSRYYVSIHKGAGVNEIIRGNDSSGQVSADCSDVVWANVGESFSPYAYISPPGGASVVGQAQYCYMAIESMDMNAPAWKVIPDGAVPYGVVAMGSFPSTSIAISPGYVTATNPLVFTMQLGRRYRVHLLIRALFSNATQYMRVVLRGSGAAIPAGTQVLHLSPAGPAAYNTLNYHWLIDGDGVSKTWDVQLGIDTGSATAYTEAGFAAFYIEDVGPTAGPVAVPPPEGAKGIVAYKYGNLAGLALTTTFANVIALTTTIVAGRAYTFNFFSRAQTNTGGMIRMALTAAPAQGILSAALGMDAYNIAHMAYGMASIKFLFIGTSTASTTITLQACAYGGGGTGNIWTDTGGGAWIEDLGPAQGAQ